MHGHLAQATRESTSQPRSEVAAGAKASLRARSLAGLFPRIEAVRAWLDRHLTPAGQWLAVAGLIAALFGLDIGRTLCWQFAALALTWLLLALVLARLQPVAVQLKRAGHIEARMGVAATLPILVMSTSKRRLDGLVLAEAPSGYAMHAENFNALYRRLAGRPPRWVSAELAWMSFRHALAGERGYAVTQHDLPPLAPGDSITFPLPFTALRRGEIRLPGLFLLATEPLGLARSVRRLAAPMDVLALPGTLPVARWRVETEAQGARTAQRPSRRQAEEEFRALRPYRPGDARRSIHWRASARRGELVVRESSGGEASRAQLALACLHAAGEEAAFEAAVQVAAACLEQRPPAPVRPTLLLARGHGVQAVEAASAHGMEAQLRALARCEADAMPASEADVDLQADLKPDFQADVQADLKPDFQADVQADLQPSRPAEAGVGTGALIEVLASRLLQGSDAEWVLTLPLALHCLHRLEQLARLHEGLSLFLVGEAAPVGPRPSRARWLRPSRLAEDWQAGGAAWP